MLNRDAGGKKGKLLCCKRIFDRSNAKLAVPGVNGLSNHASCIKNLGCSL